MRLKVFLIVFALLASLGFAEPQVNFQGSTNTIQYNPPSFQRLYSGNVGTYWPILRNINDGQCRAESDFFIAIPPGGCTPSVVRSDLLEDQNVPVFCQLYSVKTNPLIKVSSIRSITFRGPRPKGVLSISYHPARAAVRSPFSNTLIGDPIIENIGYVVIVLKRQRAESRMEDWISGNLTARVIYDINDAFGAGRSEFYLPVLSDLEWEKEFARNSFFNGRAFLRAIDISGDRARVQILSDKERVLDTLTLREGELSHPLFFPGFYCRAGFQLRLNKIVADDDQVLLNLDGEEFWVRRGNRFLNKQCLVRNIRIKEDAEENGNSSEAEVDISCAGASSVRLRIRRNASTDGLFDANLLPEERNYFEKLNESVFNLLETFPDVTDDVGAVNYAQEALIGEIKMAKIFGLLKTRMELIRVFLEKYPQSRMAKIFKKEAEDEGYLDYKGAFKPIFVSNKHHILGLVDFKKADRSKKNATFTVDNSKEITLSEGESYNVSGKGELYLLEVLPAKARFRFVPEDKNRKAEVLTVPEGDFGRFELIDLRLKEVGARSFAHVSVVPRIENAGTTAPFTFRIGIEKRLFRLSPNKSLEKAERLNKTIQKWQRLNDNLGKAVSGFKGACLATSTFLTLKNLFSGFSGENLARKKVMERYKAICSAGNEHDRLRCYDNYSSQIEKEVGEVTEALNRVNNKMDRALSREGVSQKGFLDSGEVIDEKKYKEELKKELGDFEYEFEGVKITSKDLDTVSSIRAAMFYKEMKGRSGSFVAEKDLNESLKGIIFSIQERNAEKRASSFFGSGRSFKPSVRIEKGAEVLFWSGAKGRDLANPPLGVNKEDKVQIHSDGKNDYLLVLAESTSGKTAGVLKAYKSEGGSWKEISSEPFSKLLFDIRLSDGSKCSYAWKGDAVARFYESGKLKGLPAVVPFDIRNGWYTYVGAGAGSVFDNAPKGYSASGGVDNFYICSVGPNGIMENRNGDDLCQSFNVNTFSSVKEFRPCPSLGKREVERLYRRARQAISQAASQYGSRRITVLDEILSVGPPVAKIGGLECQDVMSPSDCKVLFNACDPVVCPSSRCDFGGKFPVADVVQSGVIGSIALCLPNIREGIYVPVCLSGVHAGLDAYLSILKAQRDCLLRNAKTGETVGVCDEISSVYKCEFFWKQAAPLLEAAIPSAVDALKGGSERVRGGGEYMLISSAMDNLDKSIKFFKDNYAQGMFRAFQLRSVEEAGTSICRNFIGTSFPTSAKALDKLLEPDSPFQFYARFSEAVLSDATVPKTSRYKVFYHIYAGKDTGVQYKIFLRNPPESGYYSLNPTIFVRSGYIARGQSADETIDFTAPSGYKELCVDVNGQLKCGFSQVTTNLALNALTAMYVEDQAADEIRTEKECVSGKPSIYALANPNLGSGASDLINPDISLKGIVRICAKGAEVTDSSRWKVVGYCGDKSVKCLLDTRSVSENFGRILSLSGGKPLEKINLSVAGNGGAPSKDALGVAEKIRRKIKSFKGEKEKSKELLEFLDSVIERRGVAEAIVGTNRYIAEAMGLKAEIYFKILDRMYKERNLASGGEKARPKDEAAAAKGENKSKGDLEIGDVSKGDILAKKTSGESRFYVLLKEKGSVLVLSLADGKETKVGKGNIKDYFIERSKEEVEDINKGYKAGELKIGDFLMDSLSGDFYRVFDVKFADTKFKAEPLDSRGEGSVVIIRLKNVRDGSIKTVSSRSNKLVRDLGYVYIPLGQA